MSGAGAATRSRADFPWDEVIAFGLARLRLAPKDFWQLTPRELAYLAGCFPSAAGLSRATFTTLMQRFPDEM